MADQRPEGGRRKIHCLSVDGMLSSSLYYFGKGTFRHGLRTGASVPPLTGTDSKRNGNGRCIHMLKIVSGRFQIFRRTGSRCENERPLKSDKQFRWAGVDAAAAANMNTVPMVSSC